MRDKLVSLGALVSILWILANQKQFEKMAKDQASVYTNAINGLREKSE